MPGLTLILASRSPRRARLLHDAGYAFTQLDPPFADPPQPDPAHASTDPLALATDLALCKAQSLRAVLAAAPDYSSALILAADTLCVDDHGRIIGQPRDRDHARAILQSFLGRTHRVITGLALLAPHEPQAFTLADAADVFIHPLKPDALEAYLHTSQWQGKAGAYNLFDRQADGWRIDVSGDPTTVVGLPMQRLVPLLTRLCLAPLHPPRLSERSPS